MLEGGQLGDAAVQGADNAGDLEIAGGLVRLQQGGVRIVRLLVGHQAAQQFHGVRLGFGQAVDVARHGRGGEMKGAGGVGRFPPGPPQQPFELGLDFLYFAHYKKGYNC